MTSRRDTASFIHDVAHRDSIDGILRRCFPADPKILSLSPTLARYVHQGLNPANRRALLKALQPLSVEKCPFANLLTANAGHWGEGVTAQEMGDYVWLRPKTVAEIKFAEWTTSGFLRHGEFVALRDDIDPKQVMRENSVQGGT
jgi:ATP dependent DNA ligase C terminal region